MVGYSRRVRLKSCGAIACVVFTFGGAAHAQRANENAVAEANDAFGTAVGREVIGLYTASSARGFSPSQAGNLRISGLYFDQISMATPVNRIIRGSTVHVGISAQGFPFPAPTGVVDFQLRTPGEEAGASALLGYESYNQQYAELDFQTPVITDTLAVGGGVGYSRNNSYKIADTSDEWTAGGIARWQVNDSLVITPFWGETRHREYSEKPYVFLGDSIVPNYRGRELQSQPWTDYGFNASNFGTTARYTLAPTWMLDAGVFRSKASTPTNYEPFLTDTNSLGEGNYSISASPPRTNASTSGEVRLAKRFDTESLRNTLYVSVKARDRSGESGGADTLDLGRGTLEFSPQVPRQQFHPGPVTVVKAKQVTSGVAYEGLWRNLGQLSLAIQKSHYDRTIDVPGAPQISASSAPWLYNIGGAIFISKKLVAYASSTRGFEEIGNAPINAANRDEAVPAQLTKQVDAGLKYQFTKSLQLVAGVFEIDKPYFDLDQSNFFRQVGNTSNRGVEVSLSGALTERFTVVAGYIYIDPKVQYDSGATTRASTVAIGPIPGLFRANFQYRPALIEGLIFDAKVESTSSRYARYQDISLPAATTIDAGVRYNTHLFGKPATYRAQLYNIADKYQFTPSASGQLQSLDGRRFELSLAFDL